MSDYIVETIKLGHVTNRQIMKRMEIVGIETVDRLFSEGRSIIMMFSHCFNWGMGNIDNPMEPLQTFRKNRICTSVPAP